MFNVIKVQSGLAANKYHHVDDVGQEILLGNMSHFDKAPTWIQPLCALFDNNPQLLQFINEYTVLIDEAIGLFRIDCM